MGTILAAATGIIGASVVMLTVMALPTMMRAGYAAPIDVVTGPDGALYVGDYATGIIFKIEYEG